jgi:DNA polymerase-1
VELEGIAFDTMVAAYLLDPIRSSYRMDALAGDFLEIRTTTYEEVAGKGKSQRPFYEVDLDAATHYAAEDADVALRLYRTFEPMLEEKALYPLFEEIEMPLVPILSDMERTGVRVDADSLAKMSERLEGELERLTTAIYAEAGVEFNLNSPKQLGEILFERLGLPVLRKTRKTGAPSTSEDVLMRLAVDHGVPQLILDYRELQKLKSTYVDAIPTFINPETGRIHPSYNQTVTATGRLASSNPNIQNIPIRTELGREVRRSFITKSGWKLLSADYSQVELRVMAHLAGDEKLIEAFRRGEDIHTRTAAEVFGTSPEEVTDDQRRSAKAINFGILYGMGPHALSLQIGTSYQEANEFIKRYFERYPAVRGYIDRTLETLRENGAVTTLFDRIRSFPEVVSASGRQRSFTERAAINATIQGTAADLMKMAMIRVHDRLAREGLESRMIIQVHDELILEGPEEEMGRLPDLVRETMEGVHEMAVPLAVDTAVGGSWYEV